jgi:hypothetical protein
MSYGLHPSKELQALFRAQSFPHQGQDPNKAKVVIIGLDANYSPEISDNPSFFSQIVEYHADGIQFWEKYGVHHPFLLPNYPLKKNTGGVPYHRRFSWMGLTSGYAPHISFIELLDVPTTGRTERAEFWQLFEVGHARRIDELASKGERRLIVLSKSLVSNYMAHARKKCSVFEWLPEEFTLGEMKSVGDTIVLGAPHFSSTTYKKEVFHELGDRIRAFCENQ